MPFLLAAMATEGQGSTCQLVWSIWEAAPFFPSLVRETGAPSPKQSTHVPRGPPGSCSWKSAWKGQRNTLNCLPATSADAAGSSVAGTSGKAALAATAPRLGLPGDAEQERVTFPWHRGSQAFGCGVSGKGMGDRRWELVVADSEGHLWDSTQTGHCCLSRAKRHFGSFNPTLGISFGTLVSLSLSGSAPEILLAIPSTEWSLCSGGYPVLEFPKRT